MQDRLRLDNDPKELIPQLRVCQARLPLNNEDEQNRTLFWIVFEPQENFEEFTCKADYDWNLTKKFLLLKIKENSSQLTSETREIFRERVSFIIRQHGEGDEIIWLEPYYLHETKAFGLLIDFEFRKNTNVLFSKKGQVLSLSLDRHYRSNKDFYHGKYEKVQFFIRHYLPKLFPLITNTGNQIHYRHRPT